MRLSAPVLILAGTVAGTAAAVVAYQSAASVGTSAPEPSSVQTDQAGPVATTWLPCERGWKVVGTTCVRVRKKVVVVHDLPGPAAAQAGAAGARSIAGGSSSGEGTDEDSAAADSGDDAFEGEDAGEDPGEATEPAEDEGTDHEDVGDDD